MNRIKEIPNPYKFLILVIISRVTIVCVSWYLAHDSIMYMLRFNLFEPIPLGEMILGLFLIILKISIAIILEILMSTEIEDTVLSDKSVKRLVVANVFLLISEILVFINLLLRLEEPGINNYVIGVATTMTLFILLLFEFKNTLDWLVIVFYSLALFIYLFPTKDSDQKSPENGALVFLLRSIFLPI